MCGDVVTLHAHVRVLFLLAQKFGSDAIDTPDPMRRAALERAAAECARTGLLLEYTFRLERAAPSFPTFAAPAPGEAHHADR